MRFVSSCLLSVCVVGAAYAQDLAITDVTVFDGTGAAPYQATVMFDDGLISVIDKRAGDAPAGVPEIDGSGLSLLPGFFDLHVHYTPIGEPATTPQISEAYAAAGVTSVYDFAQPPEAFAPRRDWLKTLPGPRVNFAARMSTTNGHGADWSDTSTTKWVNTPYAAKEAVKELLPYQPDVIKVFTDGWRYGSGVDNTSMNEPTLTALVEEAHSNGLKILTHTVTKDRVEIAGRSGVDVVAHSVLDEHIDQDTINALKTAGTAYAGTLAVYNPDKFDTPDFDRQHPSFKARQARFQVGLDNMKALYEGGVLIALGTDAGMPRTPHGTSTLNEMELMVRAGLPAKAALMAGTSNSARAIGVYDQRGSIEVGKDADVVLIAGKRGMRFRIYTRRNTLSLAARWCSGKGRRSLSLTRIWRHPKWRAQRSTISIVKMAARHATRWLWGTRMAGLSAAGRSSNSGGWQARRCASPVGGSGAA